MPIYNIPVNLLNAYRERDVIVRVGNVADIIAEAGRISLKNMEAVELIGIPADIELLSQLDEHAEVDLVLQDGERELSRLNALRESGMEEDIQIVVPVVPGFGETAKRACRLGYPVKLNIGALDLLDVEETLDLVNFYLHTPDLEEPLEFFHSFAQALFNEEALTMWDIMNENPAEIRYITDQGNEVLSRRLAHMPATGDMSDFLDRRKLQLLRERGECSQCRFFVNCNGYFKLPNPEFGCDGVKRIFGTLKEAVKKLQEDVDKFYDEFEEGPEED